MDAKTSALVLIRLQALADTFGRAITSAPSIQGPALEHLGAELQDLTYLVSEEARERQERTSVVLDRLERAARALERQEPQDPASGVREWVTTGRPMGPGM